MLPGIRTALGAWYAHHGRRLAFRERADPWGVLVCEVMAQQTQIARVEPAWTAFMEAFPTPAALAAASPGSVLRAWAGMGYNRRALALQAAAGRIVERHGGAVPASVEALLALPGVGPYTARAVAAIAFHAPVAAVDTNVRRVVGRLGCGHGAPTDPGSPRSSRELQAMADSLLDPADPAAWTHAMMDVGATICRPARPRCDVCPLSTWCLRRALVEEAGPVVPAGPSGPARRGSGTPPPAFPTTRRWLRGRIVARLREQPDGCWLAIAGPIGTHAVPAVQDALAALAAEGMIEQRHDGAVRLPSSRS
jgi:A/G-specific adenine glycosylase